MQDLGGGERTTGFELTDGVKMSGGPEICQEYPGTLRRNSMRECREGGLNMNFMESYFCQVSSLSPRLPSILHPYLYPLLSSSVIPNSTTLWTITHQVPLSKGFFRQEYWSGLPFPLPEDYVLSELSTMTCPSWVALHSMSYTFIELCKSLHHDNTVIYEGWTEEALQIADERREVKSKGERERYTTECRVPENSKKR